ncbi:InlB B-repeat-containing protein, partial [Anaerococcus tetradius]
MKKAKRILALITSLTIVASNISPAFAGKFESEYNDINKDKKYPQIDNRIINTLDNDEIYNLKEGESISDPEQPDVYTYRWSYKRPVTGRSVNIKEMELASQPYVASVGEKASEEEKAKVNYKLKPPILKGYKKPEEDYQASYDFIKDNASEKETFLHNGTRDINYEPTTNSGIKVKHLFQKLEDRNSYENLDGGEDIITKQKNFFGEFPKTGQKLKLDNLFSRNVENPIGYSDREFLNLKEKIKGFEPERNADNLEIIVPEVANTPFVIHYNRKSFQVKINTDGGTYIPDMTLFYGQTIPPVTQIPKKDGAVFDHWEADKDICIKDKSGETTTIKAKTPIDMKKYQDGFRHAMPAEDITFKAIYKENETAEYSVEFWVEKADYDDKKPNLSIKDKYEFVGNRVLTGKTGSVPDIASTSKDGIAFPDLDKARLNKIYKDSTEFDKYFKYNKELTDKQNQDVSNEKVEDDSGESVYKKVSRTIDAAGNTSYKIYFDRQVYTLYFSKLITEDDSEGKFWPIITKDGEVYDSKKGNPYSFKARFNQNLQGLWPDPIENVKGYPEDYRSLGWVASTKNKAYSYRDTPPYRLTADDFLDSSDIKDKKKGGYSKTLPLGDNGEKQLGEREMCFGIDSSNQSEPYQVEFIMDTYPGFEVEGETVEKIRDYSLHYRKFDTPIADYDFTPPDIEGFEPKHEKTRIIDKKDKYDWEELNEEDSDRLEEFKTYLKFIGAPREDVKNYEDLYEKKYKIRFLGQFPEKVENDQEEENQEENKEENNQEGNQEDKNKEENNQEKENVQPIEFNDNANLEFEYSRKSYTINFNNDPRKVRDDTSYKDSEKESVPYQHPLRWLDGVYNFDYDKSDEENKEAREEYDQEHIIDNRVPEKPAWVPKSWKFLGWSLNPEGTTLVRDGNYTMPARNITLYAKWGCDTKRKVTFDLGLDAGEATKYMIKANDLKSIKYDVGDDVRTSIKENKKYKLPTEDKTSTSGKQVFLVDNGLSIKSPAIPRRPGYDFMGWEHVVYKKDSKGDDTSEVDDSFKQKYHLPRQYTFESEVYSDVYLKAIWAKNNLYDVKIKDHILDDKLNEVKTETNILENQREGTFAFYFARLQGEKLTLVADKELDQAPEDVKNTFTQYRAKLKEKSAIADNRNTDASDGVNTYYQNVKVDPTTSPNAYNELQFFYKPYRKREYKVNYLLVDNNADLNDTTKYPSVGKADPKLTKPIMDQDDVLNGNRHYDARNFRSIPGFKLVSKPQVQLVFEVNEESNKLLKINGVGVGNDLENAQVNFYYKDIRVIKNNGDKPPKGYHRVSFIAKDHGSFGKDEDGKPIKEVHYDVIDGLYFAKAHVPTNEGKKDKNDADLIADPGYQIGNWSQEGNPTSGLLDPYTVISKDYTFEINFIERKYPEISPIKVFESAKEDDSYINNFMLTKADYDKALEDFRKMPDYESYQILDDDKAIYEKLKEDPLYRDQPSDPEPIKTSIRVKINFKDKSSKEFTIPVLVYKNIYRALDSKSKPNIVNKDDFLKDFVKVTVDPTEKAADKQTKTYYVNPKAKLLIPEKDPTPEDAKKYTFEKWSDGNKDYNFKNRYEFKKDTDIQAIYKENKKDIIAYDPNEPITRPEGYVRVSFKADEGLSLGQEKAYYIRKEAKINLGNKAIEKPSVNNDIGYKFDKWDYKDDTLIDKDILVRAKATKFADIIAKTTNDESEKPQGFVEVKFVAGKNGRVEEKTYFVNPTKYVKLSPPSTKADTGYVFAGWDKNAKEFNIYNTDTTITANFNPIDSVIAKTKEDDSEKPAGFLEVKFEIKGEGGKIVDGQPTSYYVKPNTEVT